MENVCPCELVNLLGEKGELKLSLEERTVKKDSKSTSLLET